MRVLLAYAGVLEKSGGMQHVCCNMANALVAKGYDVGIGCCGADRKSMFYPVDSRVQIVSFFEELPVEISGKIVLGRKISIPQKIIREFLRIVGRRQFYRWNIFHQRKVIGKRIESVVTQFDPAIIIAFGPDMSYFLSNIQEIPIITTLHEAPGMLNSILFRDLKKSIEKTRAIQVLLPSFVDQIQKQIHCDHIVCIPNAVKQYKRLGRHTEQKYHTIICVGRIHRSKQQHILIEAFARIADQYPDWKVEFWGDIHSGKKYAKELEQSIKKHNLIGRIELKGAVKDLSLVYGSADIFCTPSQSEGFGMTIAEAMSAGLPSVGFRSSPGVNEMIKDDITGILVSDGAGALADGLATLMKQSGLRDKLGEAASRLGKQYSPQNVWAQWDKLIQNLLQE